MISSALQNSYNPPTSYETTSSHVRRISLVHSQVSLSYSLPTKSVWCSSSQCSSMFHSSIILHLHQIHYPAFHYWEPIDWIQIGIVYACFSFPPWTSVSIEPIGYSSWRMGLFTTSACIWIVFVGIMGTYLIN